MAISCCLWHFDVCVNVLMLCEEYCTSRASPDLIRSKYLQTLGKKLDPAIDILWTGDNAIVN